MWDMVDKISRLTLKIEIKVKLTIKTFNRYFITGTLYKFQPGMIPLVGPNTCNAFQFPINKK